MAVLIGEVPTFADVEASKVQALKILEESAEVYAAWQGYDETTSNGLRTYLPKMDLLEECADLIQATCNLLAALGVEDMQEEMARCREKNEKRGWRYEDEG